MTERRAFLSNIAMSGIALTGAGRSRPEEFFGSQEFSSGATAVLSNVRSFGAKGDGVTDDTAAFNAATRAAQAVNAQGSRVGIFVPPGTYRIDGTVFLHKGQSLTGAGDASLIDASRARGRTLVLGRDAEDRDDPGGAPATVGELRFWGGSDKAPLIDVPLAGFLLRNLFITSAGIAISISGGDGIVSNVIVDQALNGLILRGARNVIVDNFISYLANYAVTIDNSTNDVSLSNLILSYSKYASILFAEEARSITSVRISGATFISSIQYTSFVGHIHMRAEMFDAQFSDCIFRNWRGFAVTQEAGSGARLTFSNCVFDGSRSHASYNASSTASGIRTGIGARFRFANCQFLHLLGPVASIGPGLHSLTLDGGTIDYCSGDPIRFDGRGGGRICVRGIDGFGRRLEQKGTSSIVLPWCGTMTVWRVGAIQRGSPGGAALAHVAAFATGNTITCSMDGVQRYGAAVSLSCAIGAEPGGPRVGPVDEGNGSLCITANAAKIDWSVETAA